MPGGLAALVAGAAVVVSALSPLRGRTAWLAMAAASVSLAATVLDPSRGADPDRVPFLLVENVGLLALVFLSVRGARARWPWPAVLAALGAALATAATVLAAPQGTFAERLAGVALWLLFALLATGAALYLNWLEHDRRAALVAARRLQRLELARDLHDFVAHDVTAMVVQAQAAQAVAATDPAQVIGALARIERAGLDALASMDRTVQALHEEDDAGSDGQAPGDRRRRGLDDLPELARRFAASGTAAVDLDVEPGSTAGVAADASMTLYRVAVEALTNVRRHAPGASRVMIAVRRGLTPTPALELTIRDDGGARAGSGVLAAGRTGGLGLAGLRERVAAIGGTLDAGPRTDGWEVIARLPLVVDRDAAP